MAHRDMMDTARQATCFNTMYESWCDARVTANRLETLTAEMATRNCFTLKAQPALLMKKKADAYQALLITEARYAIAQRELERNVDEACKGTHTQIVATAKASYQAATKEYAEADERLRKHIIEQGCSTHHAYTDEEPHADDESHEDVFSVDSQPDPEDDNKSASFFGDESLESETCLDREEPASDPAEPSLAREEPASDPAEPSLTMDEALKDCHCIYDGMIDEEKSTTHYRTQLRREVFSMQPSEQTFVAKQLRVEKDLYNNFGDLLETLFASKVSLQSLKDLRSRYTDEAAGLSGYPLASPRKQEIVPQNLFVVPHERLSAMLGRAPSSPQAVLKATTPAPLASPRDQEIMPKNLFVVSHDILSAMLGRAPSQPPNVPDRPQDS